MSGGVVGVDVEALASGAAGLNGCADEVASRIARARSQVEGLLDGGWSGSAASAFGVEFAEWVAAAEDAVSVLRSLVDGVRATGAEFAAREAAAVSVSRGLEAQLGQVPSFGIAALMGGGPA